MENLKIRVENKAESKEAQELFFELGYKWFGGGNQAQYLKQSCSSSFGYLVAWSNGCFTNVIQCGCGDEDVKEITLPQLRDLVVLKRNDVNDRNVTDPEPEYSANLYLDSKGDLFVFHNPTQTWKESNLNGMDLKPIEKPMKEYLDPENGYKLNLTDRPFFDWIEVPEGSETFNYYDRKDNLFFLKSIGKDTMFSNDLNDWEWKDWGDIDFDGVVCLWSRHTLPEELPFVDDGLNIKTATGSDLDKIAEENNCRNRYNGESDEDYRYQLEHYLSAKGNVDDEVIAFLDSFIEDTTPHSHYFIDVSDVDEVDFYEIALRYNVTDPCIQHILKKCLAVGNRGHKDFHTDLKDIHDTAVRALRIHVG